MATFIGRDKLEEAKITYLNYNQSVIRGIEGELMVGDLLCKYLPSDTYVLAHPQIGKYDPDFLVVSPKYGFRIVEVKNWNLSSIQKAESNGRYIFANNKSNPIEQAKSHVECLNQYINSNFRKNLYKNIGYVVIQIGFTQNEFVSKFCQKWSEQDRKDYENVVFFKDQLNSNIDQLLLSAMKYKGNSFDLDDKNSFIKKFVESVQTCDFSIERYELNLHDKQEQEQEQVVVLSKKKKPKGRIFICLLILVLLTCFYFMSKDDDTQSVNSNAITVVSAVNKDSLGDKITIVAEVDDFSYDKKSGTKFLKLSSHTGDFEAVIFKNVTVPFINVGETYTFSGVVQEYKGAYELRIESVEE